VKETGDIFRQFCTDIVVEATGKVENTPICRRKPEIIWRATIFIKKRAQNVSKQSHNCSITAESIGC